MPTPGAVETGVTLAERSQGILTRDLATGIIILLVVMLAAQWWWTYSLARDLRQLTRECVQAIERDTASNATLVRAVDELRQAKRRNTGGAPVLPPEPKTGGGA